MRIHRPVHAGWTVGNLFNRVVRGYDTVSGHSPAFGFRQVVQGGNLVQPDRRRVTFPTNLMVRPAVSSAHRLVVHSWARPRSRGHTVHPSDPHLTDSSSSIHLVDGTGELDGSDQASKLAKCQEIIDYQFKDETLLLSALTHASGATHRLASNERLEFLGDAVLGLTVCQWLYEDYPEYSEGDLTKIKSAVVSRRSCGRVACTLGLDRCLIVGRGVTRNRSFPRSLVSDVFESVVAAMYLDAGGDLVQQRLKVWLAEEVHHAVESQGAGNFKSSLQQYAQRELSSTPVYRLVRESGPDHRKAFLIAAVIADRQFAAAWGSNKKDAEQRAASNALAELHNQTIPFPSEGESD